MKRLLFTREGRITRGQYWQAVLIFLCVSLAAALVGYALSFLPGMTVDADGTVHAVGAAGAAYAVLCSAYFVVMAWAGICVNAKRCHDRGRSAWFMLIQLLPILNIWFIVEVALLRGTQGPNMYGPDPLDAMPSLAPMAASA